MGSMTLPKLKQMSGGHNVPECGSCLSGTCPESGAQSEICDACEHLATSRCNSRSLGPQPDLVMTAHSSDHAGMIQLVAMRTPSSRGPGLRAGSAAMESAEQRPALQP